MILTTCCTNGGSMCCFSLASTSLLGDCCCCVPLRQGVLLIAGVVILFSIISLIALFTESFSTQVLVGGFGPTSKVISGVLGACGLVFGSIGMLGAYDSTPVYVSAFFYYLVCAVCIGVVVYAMDMIELRECEAWLNGVQANVNYNPTMDEIAQTGRCSQTRVEYTVSWLIDFILGCYFTFEVWRYARGVERTGHYNIGFTKDANLPPVFLAAEHAPQSQTSGYGAMGTAQPRVATRTAPPAYYGGGNGGP